MPEAWAIQAAYEEAREFGQTSELFDPGRLERALRYLLTRPTLRHHYYTTAVDCACPDHRIRGVPCKHMIAHWLEQKAKAIEAEASKEAA